jgi:ubiquinone/menaquinone biosynthesis C-methylase UbiE
MAAMNTREGIRKAYDRAADAYAEEYWDELDRKPFDRMVLERFAAAIPPGGTILEIGSGPGEVSGYLGRLGAACIGTDASARMIENAKARFPGIRFEVRDFFELGYPDASFDGVVGFYAIVNLALDEVGQALAEARRVLGDGGLLLFSFHIREGEAEREVASFFNQEGNALTFHYFDVEEMRRLALGRGFGIEDIMIRYPYPDVEYPSKRAYFLARKA